MPTITPTLECASHRAEWQLLLNLHAITLGGPDSLHDYHYPPPDEMGSLRTRRMACYLVAHLFIDLIDPRPSRRCVLDGLAFPSDCLTTMTATEGEPRDTGKSFPVHSTFRPN